MCMSLADFDLLLKAAQDTSKLCACNSAKDRLMSESGVDRNFKYSHADLIKLFKAESRRRHASERGMRPGVRVLHPRTKKGGETHIRGIDEEGYVLLRGVRGRYDARYLHKA